MKHIALILTAAIVVGQTNATAAAADGCSGAGSADKPPSTGLSVFVNAGGYWAADNAAEFYSGRDENPNKINNILKSDIYGTAIWNRLIDAGYLSPSAVGGYQQLSVAEFPPTMDYRITYQIGIGLRYDYNSGFGWLLRFDMAKLQAQGGFNLSTGGVPLLGSDQYVTCGIFGRENRYNIDLALTKTVALSNALDFELDLGASMLNTKVLENAMVIADATYSILDLTDGRIPNSDVAQYEYQNQGRIGYGFFASVLVGYRINGIGAIKLGYTCAQSCIAFQGRKEWGWQHTVGVRFELNNFSFFG
jgi:hypothetical protein